MVGKHILVKGKVQGVGYRHFVKSQADVLGISGWTRNLSDGRVEVRAVGSDEALDAFILKLRVGPTCGKVEDLDVRDIEIFDHNGHDEFEILGEARQPEGC